MIRSNTEVQIETSKGFEVVNLETALIKDRKIFITGEVNMEMADDFVRQIMFLERECREDIDIYINGPGGDVSAGLLMYDVIQSAESTINMYCAGRAYSMSAFLLASGPKGHRFILPHSKVMIHEPVINSGVGGNAATIKTLSESILETKNTAIEILTKHTGRSKKEIEKALSFDNYMTAEESVAFGICDKVVNRL